MRTAEISVGLAMQFITPKMSFEKKKNQPILSKIGEPHSTLDFTFQCKIIFISLLLIHFVT